MNLLLRFYPGDTVVLLAVNVVLQVLFAVLLAYLAARTAARRHAAERHALWVCALCYVLLCPAAAYVVDRAGMTVFAISVPRANASVHSASPFEAVHHAGQHDAAGQRNAGDVSPPSQQVAPESPFGPAGIDSSQPGTSSLTDSAAFSLGHREVNSAFVDDLTATSAVMGGTVPAAWGTNTLRLYAAIGGTAWAAGAVLLSARLLYGWWATKRLRQDLIDLDSDVLAGVLGDVRRALEVERLPPVAVSSRVAGPLCVGLLHPLVVLPERLIDGLREAELRNVLIHECAHALRLDTVMGLVQRVAAILYWPHPLVHVLNRELSRAREELCDNYVLRQADAADYAEMLLCIAERYLPARRMAVVGLLEQRGGLEQRVAGLLDLDRSTTTHLRRPSAVALSLAFFLAAAILLGLRVPLANSKEEAEDVPTRPITAVVEQANGPIVAERAENGDSPNVSRTVDLYGNPLPDGAIARLGTVRYRHAGTRKWAAFLSNSETLVVAGQGNALRFWDARSGKQVRQLEFEQEWLDAFRLSQDGRAIVALVGSREPSQRETSMRLMVWDLASGEERFGFDWTEDVGVRARRLALDPAEKMVATGGFDGRVRLWDLQSGKELLSHSIMKREIESLLFSPDGNALVAVGPSGVAYWEWRSQMPPMMLGAPAETADSVAFSPDGNLLAIGSRDCYAGLWDVRTKRFVRILAGEDPHMYRQGLAFSPDGRRLAIPSYEGGHVAVFDVGTGELSRSLDTGGIHALDVAFSSNGRLLAAVGREPEFLVWDLETGQRLGDQYVGHAETPFELAFAPDGQEIVSAGMDGTVRVWDASSGRQRHMLQTGSWISGLSLSPDGKHLTFCSLDNSVQLWDVTLGQRIYRVVGHGVVGGSDSTEIACTHDGARLVSFGSDLYLRVWDLRTGKAMLEHAIRPSGLEVRELSDGRIEVADNQDPFGGTVLRGGVQLAEDGGRLLLSVGGAIHVFDCQSGHETDVFRPDGKLEAFAVSADGRRIATLEREWPKQAGLIPSVSQLPIHLRLRDHASKSLLWEIPIADNWAGKLTFSNDSRLLAAVVRHRAAKRPPTYSIVVWETATGNQYARIDRQSDQTLRLAFSPDGKRLASTSIDSSLLVWDLHRFRSPPSTQGGPTP